MYAFLFKAGDGEILTTNHSNHISFGGETYLSNRTLIDVGSIQGGTDFPSISFTILCTEGSANRVFFAPGPSRKPASVYLVEQVADTWVERWSFAGRIGRGSMVADVYNGRIEDESEIILNSPPVRYWNEVSQKARTRNSGDISLDNLHNLSRDSLSNWKGTDADD